MLAGLPARGLTAERGRVGTSDESLYCGAPSISLLDVIIASVVGGIGFDWKPFPLHCPTGLVSLIVTISSARDWQPCFDCLCGVKTSYG